MKFAGGILGFFRADAGEENEGKTRKGKAWPLRTEWRGAKQCLERCVTAAGVRCSPVGTGA